MAIEKTRQPRLTRMASGLRAGDTYQLAMLTCIGLAVVLGCWLSVDSMSEALGAVVVVGLAFVSVWRPFAAACILWGAIPLLPENGYVLGFFVPSVFQVCVPILLIAVVARALRERQPGALGLRLSDGFLLAFMLAGFGGLFLGGRMHAWKYYANRIILVPMCYFLARMLPITRDQWRVLVNVQVVAVGLCATLILYEAVTGNTFPYEASRDIHIEGIRAPGGPFGGHFRAASFLALWAPIFLYAMSQTKSRAWWVVCIVCCGLTLTGLIRTLERAQIAGGFLGILVCYLGHAALRRQVSRLFLAGLPLIVLGSGFLLNPLTSRFQETETTEDRRAFYRNQARAQLGSSEWHPAFGTGFARGITMKWGRELEHQHAIHNTPLQLLVEFGSLGAVLATGVAVFWVLEWVRLFRRARRTRGDTAFLVAVAAVGAVLVPISYYHNTYTMSQVTATWWWLMGIVAGQGHLFVGQDQDATDAPADRAYHLAGAGHLR